MEYEIAVLECLHCAKILKLRWPAGTARFIADEVKRAVCCGKSDFHYHGESTQHLKRVDPKYAMMGD